MALCFSRRGTYVSRTYMIVLARPHTSTAETTHEEKSNEHSERPNCNDMVSPPPIEILESRLSAMSVMNGEEGTVIDPTEPGEARGTDVVVATSSSRKSGPSNGDSTHLVNEPSSQWPDHGSKERCHTVSCHRTDKDVNGRSQFHHHRVVIQ